MEPLYLGAYFLQDVQDLGPQVHMPGRARRGVAPPFLCPSQHPVHHIGGVGADQGL